MLGNRWSVGYLVTDPYGGVSVRYLPLEPEAVRRARAEQIQRDHPEALMVPDGVPQDAVLDWLYNQSVNDIKRAAIIGFTWRGRRGILRRGVLRPPHGGAF